MIGKITGIQDMRGTDHVLIDVRGVGYIVYCSDRTLSALPGKGQAVSLYTELLVREDNLQLFGFTTLFEKEWHKLLISVQGIGAKASMAILGTLGAEGVGRAITLGDATAIKAAPGVGPKIAQRVVLELKNKAPAIMALGGSLDEATGSVAAEPDDILIEAPQKAKTSPDAVAQSDALSALTNLGYGPSDAAMAVAEVAGEMADADAGALIRAALQRLAPKG
ncbi:Holliday junction DNA helicase motor protein [Rhodobacterales bacterium HTCC2150]|nr:Holliday junction DNA helicase motor protein [Rhodobacterales bacterium HTCC2150] [Rhodobacteraceae bacterium HTCC2150]